MSPDSSSEVKQRVRSYYDRFGWQKDADGYRDQSADERELVADYWRNGRRRVKRLLPQGRYLLDAGCGPILRPEQADLYKDYAVPVCVDFSETALREARGRQASGCHFVQADVTMLPFRPGAFDGVLSSHVIYHIPAEEQGRAMSEVHRALAPDGTGVILYEFPDTPLLVASRALSSAGDAARRARRMAGRVKRRLAGGGAAPRPAPTAAAQPEETSPSPRPYFFAHDRRWVEAQLPAGSFEIRSWVSLDTGITWRHFRDTERSRRALAFVSWCEDRFPRLMGRLGTYPMIVLQKGARAS
jgi:SAM-dependent methyltransferase